MEYPEYPDHSGTTVPQGFGTTEPPPPGPAPGAPVPPARGPVYPQPVGSMSPQNQGYAEPEELLVRVSVYVPESMRRRLRVLAAQRDTDVTKMVREVLTDWLSQQ